MLLSFARVLTLEQGQIPLVAWLTLEILNTSYSGTGLASVIASSSIADGDWRPYVKGVIHIKERVAKSKHDVLGEWASAEFEDLPGMTKEPPLPLI